MAINYYELENGTGHYELENGSGSLLLQSSDDPNYIGAVGVETNLPGGLRLDPLKIIGY
jgi:hypothetical protein